MSKFVNPYNFVRIIKTEAPQKKSPITHEKFTGFSGKIICTLKTLTRTFTPYNQDYAKDTLKLSTTYSYINMKKEKKEHIFKHQICGSDKKPIIPGSSLKGVIRSVAESVSNGCGFPPNNHCTNVSSLCICCRLFGMSKDTENSFLGKVSLQEVSTKEDDALINHKSGVILSPFGSPKKEHTTFYKINGQRRGRKFHYHQTEEHAENNISPIKPGVSIRMQLGDKLPKTILKSWIKADSFFTFSVDFCNLDTEELGLLLYALELEEIKEAQKRIGMYHKFGMAKSLGFGSCEVIVDKLHVIKDPRARYMSLGSNFVDYTDKIQILKESFFQSYYGKSWKAKNTLANISDMQKIMSYNAYKITNIHYPSWDWFKGNPSVQLPTIEQVFNNQNMLVE